MDKKEKIKSNWNYASNNPLIVASIMFIFGLIGGTFGTSTYYQNSITENNNYDTDNSVKSYFYGNNDSNKNITLCEEFEKVNMDKIHNFSKLVDEVNNLSGLIPIKNEEIKLCKFDLKEKTKELIFLKDDYENLNETYFNLKNKNSEYDDFFVGYDFSVPYRGDAFIRDEGKFSLYYEYKYGDTLRIVLNGVTYNSKAGNLIKFTYSDGNNYTLNIKNNHAPADFFIYKD